MIAGVLKKKPKDFETTFFEPFTQNNKGKKFKEEVYKDTTIHFKSIAPPHLSKAIGIANFRDRYILMAWGRLDNKSALAKSLNLSSEVQELSTADFILNAYLKWNKSCIYHLLGDWVFVLCDEVKQELFIGRDPAGYAYLFFYEHRDFFLFSTDLGAMLACPAIPKELNKNAIIQLSTGFKRDRQTSYKHIYRLPTAHTLTVSKNQVHRLDNYWWPTNLKPIRYKKEEDYVHHFLALFQTAVADRIGKEKTGSTLSSGLDSTSIAALAAPIFQAQQRKLHTFTWRERNVSRSIKIKNHFANEVPLARKMSERYPAIRFNEVIAKENNVIDNIKNCLAIYHEPQDNNIHIQELLEEIQQQSVKTILSGFGGNYTVSFQGNQNLYLKNLLKNTGKMAFLKQMWQWKSTNRIGWLRMFYNMSLTAYMSVDLLEERAKKKRDLVTKAYLNEATLKRELIDYEDLGTDLRQLQFSYAYPKSAIINLFLGDYLGLAAQTAHAYGLEIRSPVMDQRLIEFCLSIPNEQFISHTGTKRLIKRAMKGKVPKEILYHSKRGMQGADLVYKYKQEIPEIRSLFASFKQSPLISYWLDIPKMERLTNELAQSPITANLMPHTRLIRRGLTLGLFLQKFEAF